MRCGLEMDVGQENWEEAAKSASNLSELELTLGEVAGAVGGAEQSVTYADRSGDAFMRMVARPKHGVILHQAGRRAEAETRFREAEQMQAKRQPDYPQLYSLQGFNYCDVLLAVPERAAWQTIFGRAAHQRRPAGMEIESCRTVSQRAVQTLKWVTGKLGLLDEALDHLTLGCAALYAAILDARAVLPQRPDITAAHQRRPTDDGFETARRELDAAADGLRRAAHNEFIARGLLTRAWLRFLTGARTGPESAREDLDEAWEIAERGSMKLFMADIHLYRARLFYGVKPYPWATDAAGNTRTPNDDLAAARKLIEQCGYGRRKEELEDAEAAAKTW